MLLRSTTQLLIMEILRYVVIMWYSGVGLLCKFFFVDFRLNYVICAHLGQPSSIKVKHIVQLMSGFYIQASYSVLTFSVVLHC